MTILLHISDLHFGHTDPALIEDLLGEIDKNKPDLVVISGDFTQRALHSEFREARDFIRRIAAPVFTIPGNHDIPRYNMTERFCNPFGRYRTYINPQTDLVLNMDDLTIVGLNTARPFVPHWNWAHGMVGKRQIDFAGQNFSASAPGKCKILVCHHPLMAASGAPIDTIVWRAPETIDMLLDCHVDMVLTGHIHHASVTIANDDQLVSVGAGTATSTRLREQANGYNIIRIEDQKIMIDLLHRIDNNFVIFQTHRLKRNRASVRQ
jgi:3',5'-cyclic AMP phosphodiesterase CpdA